jgi:hypothetical protein
VGFTPCQGRRVHGGGEPAESVESSTVVRGQQAPKNKSRARTGSVRRCSAHGIWRRGSDPFLSFRFQANYNTESGFVRVPQIIPNRWMEVEDGQHSDHAYASHPPETLEERFRRLATAGRRRPPIIPPRRCGTAIPPTARSSAWDRTWCRCCCAILRTTRRTGSALCGKLLALIPSPLQRRATFPGWSRPGSTGRNTTATDGKAARSYLS